MIRTDCPRCGHEGLEFDSLMAGPVEVTRICSCPKCDWSLATDMPTPDEEPEEAPVNKIPSEMFPDTIYVPDVGQFRARIDGSRVYLAPIPTDMQPRLKPGQLIRVESPSNRRMQDHTWRIEMVVKHDTDLVLSIAQYRVAEFEDHWSVTGYYHDSPPEPKVPRALAIQTTHTSASSAQIETWAARHRTDLGRITMVSPDGTELTWTREAGQQEWDMVWDGLDETDTGPDTPSGDAQDPA